MAGVVAVETLLVDDDVDVDVGAVTDVGAVAPVSTGAVVSFTLKTG